VTDSEFLACYLLLFSPNKQELAKTLISEEQSELYQPINVDDLPLLLKKLNLIGF
jgi:hypothetical protein